MTPIESTLNEIEKRIDDSHTMYCDNKDIPKLIQAVRLLSAAIEQSKEELPEAYEFYFEEALAKTLEILK